MALILVINLWLFAQLLSLLRLINPYDRCIFNMGDKFRARKNNEHRAQIGWAHLQVAIICTTYDICFSVRQKKKKELKMTILFFSVFLSFFSFFSFHDCFLRYMVYNVSLTLFCINDLKVSQLSVIILQGWVRRSRS